MYSRLIDGEEYTFGVSGKLIRNVLVMYDRQTNSLWSQLLGRAVEGPLAGTELEFLPSWQTTWEEWVAKHPDTLALEKGYAGAFDPYDGYYASGQTGVIGETFSDNRLYVKEFVVGIEQDGEAVAYPFSVLNESPVINDRAGSQAVLIVFSPESASAVAFNRSLKDRELTFKILKDGEIGPDFVLLRDLETGTTWDGLTGKALDGELAGQVLERIKSTRSFWFGWKDFYPNTRVYELNNE